MMTYEKAKQAIQESLAAAEKIGYIDLYALLHQRQGSY